jgi:hypothetical protein
MLESPPTFMRRYYNRHSYSRLEWCSNGTLQLQRLAHEELGIGTWGACTQDIPVTREGEMLGILDVTDPGHPVFKMPQQEVIGDRVSSDGGKEQSEAGHVEDTREIEPQREKHTDNYQTNMLRPGSTSPSPASGHTK